MLFVLHSIVLDGFGGAVQSPQAESPLAYSQLANETRAKNLNASVTMVK